MFYIIKIVLDYKIIYILLIIENTTGMSPLKKVLMNISTKLNFGEETWAHLLFLRP